jgi:ribonuclease-3
VQRPSERRALVAAVLGHTIDDAALLELACSHSSLLDAQADRSVRIRCSNERLEFLGDTLLDAAIGQRLYDRFPDADEGNLSRFKARLVSRELLARAMEQLRLLPVCRVGDKMQEPWPDSVKANFAESLLAAIYKDGGWSALTTAVDRLLGSFIEQVEDLCHRHDPKGDLQDWALRHHQQLPDYSTRRCGGSDHEPEFACLVTIGERRAEGHGGSRRKAEMDAARCLFDAIHAEVCSSSHVDESIEEDSLPP